LGKGTRQRNKAPTGSGKSRLKPVHGVTGQRAAFDHSVTWPLEDQVIQRGAVHDSASHQERIDVEHIPVTAQINNDDVAAYGNRHCNGYHDTERTTSIRTGRLWYDSSASDN
jgi:hypothetical protein